MVTRVSALLLTFDRNPGATKEDAVCRFHCAGLFGNKSRKITNSAGREEGTPTRQTSRPSSRSSCVIVAPPTMNGARGNTNTRASAQSRRTNSTRSRVAAACQVSRSRGFAAPKTAGVKMPTLTPIAADDEPGDGGDQGPAQDPGLATVNQAPTCRARATPAPPPSRRCRPCRRPSPWREPPCPSLGSSKSSPSALRR